ncbi:von Willebrand factor type A domain-containing protein [Spongiactinospora sp. TRM90649]|uniref:vWA domain-containing protein n=1 Tax=Spongiactinospora sp. TRM90649 TaxID=3031114 RepID=UPI0023F97ED0|nr:von Willebrand factor type A domain-containing protein [Spongiactinospora sp. TRM90649]MDF5755310.1 von Willebrand factor type A domain-containing protein [Spongiactinospora sp. TRM90649]
MKARPQSRLQSRPQARPIALVFALIVSMFAAACSGSGADNSSEAAPKAGSKATSPVQPPAPRASAAERSAPAEPGEEGEDQKAAESAERGERYLSTFALDVDTASYGYARRTLREGALPDPAQVRPEEFVNAFRQDYTDPAGDGFTVRMDGARTPENGTAVVRVGLRTRAVEAAARRPANLTFVVDVSGSMAEPGRLDLVRESLHTLIDQLAPADSVSIVSFSDDARLVIGTTPVSDRADLHAAVERLSTEGGTNLGQGLEVGYREAAAAFRSIATNRVVLLSDGLANSGETDWRAILDRVGEHAGRKITLLCVGVGREYGDELMEQLADNGDGAAVYVSTGEEAREVFAERLTTTLEVRARDAKAQVAFNPSTVESYRLIGYENRALSEEEFRDDSRDGGEIGPGHSVTALYRVRLRAGGEGKLATATVRWQDPDTRDPAEAGESLEVGALAAGLAESSPRLRVDTVAADFAEHLRGRWRAHAATAEGSGLAALGAEARRLAESTEDPAVAELADLIDRARSLE